MPAGVFGATIDRAEKETCSTTKAQRGLQAARRRPERMKIAPASASANPEELWAEYFWEDRKFKI
jgi:hypothetical protein